MDKKNKGWIILNSRNQIEVSQPIAKINLIVKRANFLGKQKIRISRKALLEAFETLDKKAQRVRK